MQLINYTQPRLFTVAVALDEKKLRHVTMVPGINELTDSDWKAIKDHPHVKHVLEEGHLELLKSRPGDGSTLKSMTQDKAIETIQETFSVDLLKKWLLDETRPLVIRTISMKLNELVLPDRQEKILGKEKIGTAEASAEGLDEEFPRADKLGEDAVAKKLAGKAKIRK